MTTGVIVAMVVGAMFILGRTGEPEDRVDKMTRDIERWRRLRKTLRSGR